MKLRNKKTDEIIDFDSIRFVSFDKKIQLQATNRFNRPAWIYNSLAELNEVWEDHEEPKDWHIGCEGDVFIDNTEEDLQKYSVIGNDFTTKEEAEKAVEKLKAWKRLRKNGFRFNGWYGTQVGSNISYISEIYYEGCSDDMDLLFGGEE